MSFSFSCDYGRACLLSPETHLLPRERGRSGLRSDTHRAALRGLRRDGRVQLERVLRPLLDLLLRLKHAPGPELGRVGIDAPRLHCPPNPLLHLDLLHLSLLVNLVLSLGDCLCLRQLSQLVLVVPLRLLVQLVLLLLGRDQDLALAAHRGDDHAELPARCARRSVARASGRPPGGLRCPLLLRHSLALGLGDGLLLLGRPRLVVLDESKVQEVGDVDAPHAVLAADKVAVERLHEALEERGALRAKDLARDRDALAGREHDRGRAVPLGKGGAAMSACERTMPRV